MPRYDFRTPRLYVDAPLADAASVPLDSAQANYLGNVLRLRRRGHCPGVQRARRRMARAARK